MLSRDGPLNPRYTQYENLRWRMPPRQPVRPVWRSTPGTTYRYHPQIRAPPRMRVQSQYMSKLPRAKTAGNLMTAYEFARDSHEANYRKYKFVKGASLKNYRSQINIRNAPKRKTPTRYGKRVYKKKQQKKYYKKKYWY